MHIRSCTSRDAPALAAAYINSFKYAYRRILDDDDLAGLRSDKVEGRIRRWLGSGALMFAGIHKREGIVGFITAGPSDGTQASFSAEIYAHCVVEDFQNRGLGHRLLAAAVHELKAQHGAMLIWLPAKNSATAYYEKLGAERIASRPMVLEGKNLEAVALGWSSLAAFPGVE